GFASILFTLVGEQKKDPADRVFIEFTADRLIERRQLLLRQRLEGDAPNQAVLHFGSPIRGANNIAAGHFVQPSPRKSRSRDVKRSAGNRMIVRPTFASIKCLSTEESTISETR